MTKLIPSRREFVIGLAWVIAAGVLALAMWGFGHRQFGGFDHSALVDTAWRIASQQKPYEDFYLTTPVGFYLGAGLAFSLWGATWTALVGMSIVFALVSFALLTACLRSYAPPGLSIGLALACELLAMGVTSYWWYNSITAIAACAFLAAAVAFVRRPSSWAATGGLTLATFLLLLMKPNTAGLLVVLVVAILLSLREAVRRLAVALVASSALLLALLAALGISPLAVMGSYMEIARTRGLPSAVYFTQHKPGEAYLTIPLVLMALLPLATIAKPIVRILHDRPARHTQALFIAAAGALTGLLGMFTDSDSNLVVGVPLVLISSLSLFLWLWAEGSADNRIHPLIGAAMVALAGAALVGVTELSLGPSLTAREALWGLSLFAAGASLALWAVGDLRPALLLTGMLVFMAAVALLAGRERLRVKYIGPGVFYSDEPLVEIPEVRFFEGMVVSPRLRGVVEDIALALDDTSIRPAQPSLDVYFGPRLEFAYAAFQLPSPTHLPIWYDAGNSYAEAAGETIVRSFLSRAFDLAIFLKTEAGPDFTYLPQPIIEDIGSHYARVDYPEIVVFVRDTK